MSRGPARALESGAVPVRGALKAVCAPADKMSVVEIPVSQGCVEGDGGAPERPAKRVLFVDDEVDVLDSLRDALRRY
jgi:hypothetical protein